MTYRCDTKLLPLQVNLWHLWYTKTENYFQNYKNNQFIMMIITQIKWNQLEDHLLDLEMLKLCSKALTSHLKLPLQFSRARRRVSSQETSPIFISKISLKLDKNPLKSRINNSIYLQKGRGQILIFSAHWKPHKKRSSIQLGIYNKTPNTQSP